MTASIQVEHYPNVQAQTLSAGSPVILQQLVDYAKNCVKPGLQYFLDKFSNDSSVSVSAFKTKWLFLPQKVVEFKPDAATLDSLQAFPFLKPSILRNLKSELPTYLAKAGDIDASIHPLDWWRNHSADLPYWFAAAADVLLVQRSSAAAGRVFFITEGIFRVSAGCHIR